MTKLYFEPIRVVCDEEDRPRLFFWRSRPHHVTLVLKRWSVCVDWWRQEVSRQYYRVECENRPEPEAGGPELESGWPVGTYEIYRERDRWFLERLYD